MARIFRNIFFCGLTYLHCGFSQTCSVSFSPAVNYTLGFSPGHPCSADFDGDGNADLAFPQSSTTSLIHVMLGSSSGTFAAPQSFSAGNGSNDLVATDLNGDGNKDLVIANFSGNDISILLGTGTGSFSGPVNYTVAAAPRHLAAADFNNDNKTDIVVGGTGAGSVSVLFGNGNGGFSLTANFMVGSGPMGVIAADFNGDANTDIVTANSGSNDISLLTGNGNGSFSTVLSFTTSGNCRKLTDGDFNNDGKLDVAVGHFQSPQVSVLLGTGTGSFTPSVTYVSGIGSVVYGITSADLNNDGSIDLATANNALSTAAFLAGSQSGTFATGVGFSVQAVPIGIVKDDFDNDGRIDLAVSNVGGNSISVLLNSTALPALTVTSTSGLLCPGQNATLTANGAATYSWTNGPGSSTFAVSPTVTASYSVTGTGTNSCRSIAAFTQSVSACTGILAANEQNHFRLWPNPFSETFLISGLEIGSGIEIFNSWGMRIKSIEAGKNELEIDLLNEKPGIYIVKTGRTVNKIIKH